MTFRIERHLFSYYNGRERLYEEGQRLKVEISALGGLSTKPATLVSLPEGEGFIAGDKVIRPPKTIWTDKGWAVAK